MHSKFSIYLFLLIELTLTSWASANQCNSYCDSWLSQGTQQCRQFIQSALQQCRQIGSTYSWVAPGEYDFGSCGNYAGGINVPARIGPGPTQYDDRQWCEQIYSGIIDPCGQAAQTIRNTLDQATCNTNRCTDPDYPYYNSNNNKCYQTPCFDPAYPYFNASDNKCYLSNPNTNNNQCTNPSYPYYNSKDNNCYQTPCFDPAYPYYNTSDNKCYSRDPNTNNQCSNPNYPYYNSNDNSCYSTPCFNSNYPYFNTADNQCYQTPCFNPDYPYYNAGDNKCYSSNPNTNNNKCTNPSYPYYNSKDNNCYQSPCFDPAYTYYNAGDNKCYSSNPNTNNNQCNDPAYPYYNSTDTNCYRTPCFDSNYPYYDSNSNKCYQTPCFDPNYPYFNAADNLCYSSNPNSNSNSGQCNDPAYPYYNSQNNYCYKTPCFDSAYPYYNPNDGLCYAGNQNTDGNIAQFVVSLGTNRAANIGEKVMLSARILPESIANTKRIKKAKYRWQQLSGPQAAMKGSPTASRRTFTAVSVGTYEFSVVAYDASSESAPASVSIIVDPQIDITSPSPGESLAISDKVNLNWSVSAIKSSKPLTVYLSLDGGDNYHPIKKVKAGARAAKVTLKGAYPTSNAILGICLPSSKTNEIVCGVSGGSLSLY
jgi:hypothetical protein